MTDSANLGQLERLSVSSLTQFHKNPRRGNVDSIVESIRVNGIYKPIIVNRGSLTGRENEILAGNHTVQAVNRLAEEDPEDPRWSEIDVYVVDVDDDAAARIVVADNRTSDLASTDTRSLLELLSTIDGVEGTGYIDDDVEDLRALLEEMGDDGVSVTDYDGNPVRDYDDDEWEVQPGDRATAEDDEEEEEELTEEEYAAEIERFHDKYTHAAKAPTYEPQEETAPPLEELIDTTKTDRLLSLIDAAEGIPERVKDLLRATAHRHTIINFKKIAEWYAHQPGEIQELAEQQALVILDLEHALREGYARLTGELRRHALRESGYDDSHPDPAHRNPHLDETPEDIEIRERARTRSSAGEEISNG